MKKYLLLLEIILLCLKSFAQSDFDFSNSPIFNNQVLTNSKNQCLNSESEFKEYFAKNIQNLDPIEGIWSVNKTVKKYTLGEFIRTQTNQNIATWAIIKDREKFIACNMENNKLAVVTFSKTAIDGVYIYNKSIIANGRKYTSNATLTANSLLEYSYPDQYEDIFDDLKDRYEKKEGKPISDEVLKEFVSNVEIINEFKWIKTYPTKTEFKKSTTSTGTGFAISANGYITTCYHVIDGATSIKVKGIGGNFSKSYSAKVISTDANNDIAIIKIDDTTFTTLGTIPYTIKATSSDVGSSIFILGYPLTATMGDEIKLTNGIVSAKSGFKGDITSYQITAAAQPGNSGGPLFDKNGNLIGIVNAKHVEAESATYAVKSNYLMNLIESLPTTPTLQTVNSLTWKALTDQVKAIKNFVYIIEIN